MGTTRGEPSAAVAERVVAAREVALRRGVRANAHLPAHRLDEVAPLSDGARSLLAGALRSGRLSARSLHRVRRVARSIPELQCGPPALNAADVAPALRLRVDAGA